MKDNCDMTIPMQTLEEIRERLGRRISDHYDDVTETLRQVSTGGLALPETLSPQEARDVRDIFSWIADVGPQEVLKMLEPVLAALSSPRGQQPFTVHLGGWFVLKREDASDDAPGFGVTIVPGPNFDGQKVLKAIVRLIHAERRTKERFAVLLMSYIFYDEFHYPQPETGVYDIADNPFQKLKWVYRYWFNQLEVAEKGSGLEAFFASQDIFVGDPIHPIDPPFEHKRLSLSCGGDLLAVDVLTPENTPHLFGDITDFYSRADIVSANLESTVSDDLPFGRYQKPGEEDRPFRMNTSEAMFNKFRDEAKINYFSTATNHAMDWGKEGVDATLDVLEESGADYSGTAKSQAGQDDVVVVNKNGIKVALLAFTFDLNGKEKEDELSKDPYLVNLVRFNDADPAPDYSLIEKQVAIAKEKGADHIVAYCHWGWEFEMYPHLNIVEAAHKVIECGVDTILGNHPHVSQPAQLIERPNLPPALVIYAFGDFVSYHPESRNSKLAYLVKFDIVKYSGGLSSVANLKALPIYIVNADLGGDRYDCRIVKFENVLKNPDDYGLTDLEKSQLPHLRDKVWKHILSPLANLPV